MGISSSYLDIASGLECVYGQVHGVFHKCYLISQISVISERITKYTNTVDMWAGVSNVIYLTTNAITFNVNFSRASMKKSNAKLQELSIKL